jgi:hypothetical protein
MHTLGREQHDPGSLPSPATARWSPRPAAASLEAPPPFLVSSKILAFSALVLKVYIDTSMVNVSPNVDREERRGARSLRVRLHIPRSIRAVSFPHTAYR